LFLKKFIGREFDLKKTKMKREREREREKERKQ